MYCYGCGDCNLSMEDYGIFRNPNVSFQTLHNAQLHRMYMNCLATLLFQKFKRIFDTVALTAKYFALSFIKMMIVGNNEKLIVA